MNEKQFLEMAERERDAWIEQHIMGNEVEWDVADSSASEKKRPYIKNNSELRLGSVLEYSNDNWDNIRPVIEKMRGLGWYVATNNIHEADEWEVFFIRLGDGKKHTAVHTDFLAAIYLAAGRALGVIE